MKLNSTTHNDITFIILDEEVTLHIQGKTLEGQATIPEQNITTKQPEQTTSTIATLGEYQVTKEGTLQGNRYKLYHNNTPYCQLQITLRPKLKRHLKYVRTTIRRR